MKRKHRSKQKLASTGQRIGARLLIGVALVAMSACTENKNLQPKTAVTSGGSDGFAEADANHDGKLSRNEASDFLVNEVYNSRDANHDGKMTQQEWTAGDPKRAADFQKRDANGDGVVTKQEAITYGRAHGVANKVVKDADKNGDGQLDRSEVQAYYASREGPPG